jgi:hypothetical protein
MDALWFLPVEMVSSKSLLGDDQNIHIRIHNNSNIYSPLDHTTTNSIKNSSEIQEAARGRRRQAWTGSRSRSYYPYDYLSTFFKATFQVSLIDSRLQPSFSVGTLDVFLLSFRAHFMKQLRHFQIHFVMFDTLDRFVSFAILFKHWQRRVNHVSHL